MAFSTRRPGPGALASVTGVTAGLLFFLALLAPWLLAVAWGGMHCSPAPGCRSAVAVDFATRALLALAPAIAFGAALRSLLGWLGARLRAGKAGGKTGVRVPWFGLGGMPLAILGGVLLVWGDLLFAQA